jgi:NAD-dependent dihydropyrimidine dehydrogenase PreA subunit
MAEPYSVDVDFEACKACGYCALVCPMKVFAQGSDINKKGYTPYRPATSEDCTGCLRCFYMCPDFCLEVADRHGKQKPAAERHENVLGQAKSNSKTA